MAKIDLVSREWTDLVFQGRNKEYGAYKLRQGTSKRNIWSILIVLITAIIAFSAIAINKVIQANRKVENVQTVDLSVIKEKKQAKVEKKEQIKVEPEKVIEKVKSSVKFTAPVIKKDSEVKEEEQIDLSKIEKTNTTIGAFTVEGNDEVGGAILKAKEEIAAPEPPKHEEETKVFDVVEQMPSFPGGMGALNAWLVQNTVYPVIAAENGVQGKVTVQFVVEKDGSITGVTVVRSVDPSLDKEAARVVKSMPRWQPGKQNGSFVRVKYTVPVTFKLQ
ncbi:MAG: TonB family protein [Prevotellaceae bacterium]|nr:TonB family protein [Prevotella sp.]MDD7257000.1 TonB family protein [Prevotellaceae bacterium]MDY6130261.1 TonB family protein [Prevotella sp.]